MFVIGRSCLGSRNVRSGRRHFLRFGRIGWWNLMGGFFASGRSDVAGIDGEKGSVLRCPLGGEAVEWTFCVVLLVSDHAADADDEIVETFGSGPEVADADAGVVEVGMEDGREHAALRRAAWIAERKIDFELVDIALEDFTVGRYEETLDVVGDAIDLRRHPRSAGEHDDRPVGKASDESFVVELEAACARGEHRR